MDRKEYSAGAVKHSFWFMEFRKVVSLRSEGKTWDDIKQLNDDENLFGASTSLRSNQILALLCHNTESVDSQENERHHFSRPLLDRCQDYYNFYYLRLFVQSRTLTLLACLVHSFNDTLWNIFIKASNQVSVVVIMYRVTLNRLGRVREGQRKSPFQ